MKQWLKRLFVKKERTPAETEETYKNALHFCQMVFYMAAALALVEIGYSTMHYVNFIIGG